MPVITLRPFKAHETAREAAEAIAPRMARKLAEFQRDELLQMFTAQPGGRAGPSNDTFALHDSTRVEAGKEKNAAELHALDYWRFVMEYGAYLEVPERRIAPPLLVSQAAEAALEERDKILETELLVFRHRVEEAKP